MIKETLQYRYIKYLATGLTICVIISFYVILFIGAPNIAISLDDARMFQRHFGEYWVNSDGFLNKLYYFIRLEKWPHPKIIGRIATLISYYSVGSVNITLLTFLGNLGLLLTWLLTYLLLEVKQKIIYLLPITILLFTNYDQNFWTILSFSFGYRFLLVGATLYFLSSHKIYLSFIFSFLAVFSGGVGFLVFPIVALYYLIELYTERKFKKVYLVWFCWGIICLVLFYFFTLNSLEYYTKKSTEISTDVGLFSKLLSNASYSLSLIGLLTHEELFYILSDRQDMIIGGLCLLSLLGMLFFVTLKDKSSKIIFCLMVYMFGLILVAAIMRDDVKVIGENSEPRYLVYSIHFWIPFLLLACNTFYSQKWFKYVYGGFGVLLLFSFLMTYPDRLDRAKERRTGKTLAFYNGLVGDDISAPFICSQVKSKRDKCVQFAKDGLNEGFYKLPSQSMFTPCTFQLLGKDDIVNFNDNLILNDYKVHSFKNIYKLAGYFTLKSGRVMRRFKTEEVVVLAKGIDRFYLISGIPIQYRKGRLYLDEFVDLEQIGGKDIEFELVPFLLVNGKYHHSDISLKVI